MSKRRETWFSIDVETSGSVPGLYDLVSIGACVVGDPGMSKCTRCDYESTDLEHGPCIVTSQVSHDKHLWGGWSRKTFYEEIVPHGGMWDDEAGAVHGLTQEHLRLEGVDPKIAIVSFNEWVVDVAGDTRPVFGSWSTFDWMWMGYYLEKFGKRYTYPFGPSSLEFKSYYLGLTKGTEWRTTAKGRMPKEDLSGAHTHNALADAIEQAEMVEKWQVKYGKCEIGGSGTGCCAPRLPAHTEVMGPGSAG